MKTIYIPNGETVHYESLVTDRLVVQGCVDVDGSIKAKIICGGGAVYAGAVHADIIHVDDLETSETVCKRLLAKRVHSGNEECRSEQWKVLSLDKMKYPKLTFHSRNNLRAVLSQQVIRRKLLRFLRDHFRWPGVDEVRFYDDLLPYSFFFQEYCNGRQGICGGVILHNQQDWSRAYYSLHT